jgi:predicted phosphoribosyltransferase
MYYDDFSQTSDHEVLALLERAARSQADTLTE